MATKITIQCVERHFGIIQELSKSIQDALNEYGFDAQIKFGMDLDCAFTVVMGCKGQMDWPEGHKYVLIETDHIDTPLRQRTPINYSDKAIIRSLHWSDYKRDLRDKNIYYCPIGYSKHFDTNIKREDLQDSFHMGRSGGYGLRDAFRAKYNLWTTPAPVSGDVRDKIMVTSKININSKLQENYWFTPMHASLTIHKGKLLMQEDCEKDDYNFYKPYMILFNQENFKEKYDYWLNHDKERHEFEQFVYEDIRKNHPYNKYFYAAMEDILKEYV
jgi:hypothetical protein